MKVSLSVICCYNNSEMYNDILVKSLKDQMFSDYELIGIDNSEGKFENAAAALNFATSMANANLLLFVHQDFEFIDKNALESIYNVILHSQDRDVIGVAGAIKNENASFFTKFIGRDRKIISTLGENKEWEYPNEKCKVNTLDECCFGFNKCLWEEHPFDSDVCSAWDLYAVEMCLYAASKGGQAYVIPTLSIHHSYGHLTTKFYQCMFKLSIKYRQEFSEIVTTCVVTDTKHPYREFVKLWFVNCFRQWYGKVVKNI